MPQFYNPNLPDSVINVTPEEVKKFLGGDETLARSGYVPYPGLPQAAPASAGTGTAGAAGIDTGKANTAIDTFVPYTQTDLGKKDQQTLKEMMAGLGILTPQEEADIKAQAKARGLQYDTLINQAKEERRMGMAKANVRAGQKGGFESTQIAGAAALAPTEGGTFVGQGGTLEQVKSAFDLNIQNLEVQKQQAIAEAENALRTAKLTKKSADFDRAREMFKLAQDSHNEALSLAFKKIEALKTIQETKNLAAKSEQPFFSGSDLVSLMKEIPEGQSKDLTDPSTGKVYTVVGVSKDNPDVVQFIDDKGSVQARDKNTGELLWQTGPGVGKTKSVASINIPKVTKDIIVMNGKQIGYQYTDPYGKITNTNMNNEPLGSFPAGASVYNVGSQPRPSSASNIFGESVDDLMDEGIDNANPNG